MKFVLSTFGCETRQLPDIARAADESGWAAMSFSDHVIHPETITTPYPYTDDGSRRWEAFTEWPDPWVMIGAMAAVTKNLRFTNNAFVLPIRNPFLVAKAVGTAAVLSGNRVTLTIGIGWSKDEYELLQQDFHTRGKRADEMVEIMRKLWSGRFVEHHGKHYNFGRLEMNPAPTADIPIWVAGISDFALKRAARLGDGWLSDLQSSEEIIGCIDKLRAFRADYGREQQPFDVMATPNDAFDRQGYARLEDAGVTHILTQPWQFYHGDTADLDKKIDGVHRFAADYFQD